MLQDDSLCFVLFLLLCFIFSNCVEHRVNYTPFLSSDKLVQLNKTKQEGNLFIFNKNKAKYYNASKYNENLPSEPINVINLSSFSSENNERSSDEDISKFNSNTDNNKNETFSIDAVSQTIKVYTENAHQGSNNYSSLIANSNGGSINDSTEKEEYKISTVSQLFNKTSCKGCLKIEKSDKILTNQEIIKNNETEIKNEEMNKELTEEYKVLKYDTIPLCDSSDEYMTLNKYNESAQCPSQNSQLVDRYRKSRYLAFPNNANLVVTLNLLKGTPVMMGFNTLHEVDIFFPLPRSLFVFEYETMHGTIRPKVKPANQRTGFIKGLENIKRIWNNVKLKYNQPHSVPFYSGVPQSHQQFFRQRSLNDKNILLSQLESALQVFGIDGKSCITHLICAAKLSSGSHSLLHELAEIIFKRNVPETYQVLDNSTCKKYACEGILHGLSRYLFRFTPDTS